MITIIVACDKNLVIGKDGKIPWHIPEDLKLFKELTTNKTIVMGKNTWNSLPKKPLPNRRNVVLTHNPIENVECYSSIEEIVRNVKEDIYVIGGAQVYKEFLDKELVDRIFVSEVKNSYSGDTYFPKIDNDEWLFWDGQDYDEFYFKKLFRG